jgi:hypothetical protein
MHPATDYTAKLRLAGDALFLVHNTTPHYTVRNAHRYASLLTLEEEGYFPLASSFSPPFTAPHLNHSHTYRTKYVRGVVGEAPYAIHASTVRSEQPGHPHARIYPSIHQSISPSQDLLNHSPYPRSQWLHTYTHVSLYGSPPPRHPQATPGSTALGVSPRRRVTYPLGATPPSCAGTPMVSPASL